MLAGVAYHGLEVGGVNILFPHRRSITVSMLLDHHSGVLERTYDTVVTGVSVEENNFHVTQPDANDDLVLMVLRDPPGARSSAVLEDDLSYKVDVSFGEGIGQFAHSKNQVRRPAYPFASSCFRTGITTCCACRVETGPPVFVRG